MYNNNIIKSLTLPGTTPLVGDTRVVSTDDASVNFSDSVARSSSPKQHFRSPSLLPHNSPFIDISNWPDGMRYEVHVHVDSIVKYNISLIKRPGVYFLNSLL